MDNPYSSPISGATKNPPRTGRFAALQALIWLLAAPLIGMAVARAAVWAQNFRAPLLIFPLLVGCVLGLLLVALLRLGQIGHRATIWSCLILAVAVTVAGQHYFSFLDFKSAVIAKKPQGLSPAAVSVFQEMMPDTSTNFVQFMQRQAIEGRPVTAEFSLHGAAVWTSWAGDGLLTLLAAMAIVYLACREPYCSVCRSWYRTIRSGPLDAEKVRRLAEAAALPIEEALGAVQTRDGGTRLGSAHPTATARYRLSHCLGGCGPSRLEIAGNGPTTTKSVEAWLSVANREQVARVLDGAD